MQTRWSSPTGALRRGVAVSSAAGDEAQDLGVLSHIAARVTSSSLRISCGYAGRPASLPGPA